MDTISKEFPAFPRNYEADGHNGMTLRDYFVAQALPSIITAYIEGNGRCIGSDHFISNVPVIAYRLADALIAARGV